MDISTQGPRLDVGEARQAGTNANLADAPRVAFQGELGAFSEDAVHRFFLRAEPVATRTFGDVVRCVESGGAEYGLLPIENTLHGGVADAYDALTVAPVSVVGEVVLPIRHCLLAPPGAAIADLRRVVSHPVALAQCRGYLSGLHGVEVLAVYDTAGAARDVAARGVGDTAAVASRRAGSRYGLDVLAADIQDRMDNQTRFLAIGRVGTEPFPAPPGATFKTAVLCETPNEPGALVRLLAPLAEHGVNLTRLESRPGPTPWTYRFFLEFTSPEPGARERALEDARPHAVRLDVLGTFAAAAAVGAS